MIRPLRTYEIFEHNKATFHARWRDHAMPMDRRGFGVLSICQARGEGRTELAIKRITREQHRDLVGEVEDRVLEQLA